MKIKMQSGLGWLLIALLSGACSDTFTESKQAVETPAADGNAAQELSVKLHKDIVAQLDGTQRELTIPTGSHRLDAGGRSAHPHLPLCRQGRGFAAAGGP